MQNYAKIKAEPRGTGWFPLGSDQWFSGVCDHRLGHTKSGHVAGTMTGKHTMGPFGLDELDLDDGRPRLIHARDTTARQRLEGEKRHGGSALTLSRR